MARKTICVKAKDLVIFKEGYAGGTITPGHLLQGLPAALIVHAAAAGTALPMFAVERGFTGDDIDTDYVANDTVSYGVFPPGSEVWAIADATGVTAGDIVESNGDGTFQTQAASASTAESARSSVVGRALTTAAAGARFVLEVY